MSVGLLDPLYWTFIFVSFAIFVLLSRDFSLFVTLLQLNSRLLILGPSLITNA